MIIAYSTNSETGRLRESSAVSSGGWVRAERPSASDIETLHSLGINADLLKDALDPHEVPRIESDDGWTYFITRVPDVGDDFNDYTTPIMFALGKSQTITISRDLLGRLWQPYIEKSIVSTSNRTQLFISMVESLLQSYQTRVATINRQMRAVTSDITTLRSREIATLVEFERKLNDYLDALIPTNVALEKTLNRRNKLLKLADEDQDMVKDMSVDIEQLIARCKSLLRTIQNVRDSFRAVMDTRLNETMRVLTVATLALTIPTMIAGIFGMNVELPFEVDTTLTFWIIVGVSLAATFVTTYYFVKKR